MEGEAAVALREPFPPAITHSAARSTAPLTPLGTEQKQHSALHGDSHVSFSNSHCSVLHNLTRTSLVTQITFREAVPFA